jgi:enoyl-ACP reductase-like protein
VEALLPAGPRPITLPRRGRELNPQAAGERDNGDVLAAAGREAQGPEMERVGLGRVAAENGDGGLDEQPARAADIRRAAERGVTEEELRRSRAEDNLLGRWAKPREVAYAILFLACHESSFITGITLMVDGGRSIL